MKKTLLNLALVGASLLALTRVEAASITDINIQIVGAGYDPVGGFTMGGGTPFTIDYESDPSTLPVFGNFSLSTVGMASVISGNTISYTGAGSILLKQGLVDLFGATLQSLSMTLNAGGGFTGVGQFNNISESLVGDFTTSGGIANFGFSFNGTATSWTSGFGGLSSAILSAQSPSTPGTSVPDGGLTLSLLGISLLSISAGYRKFARS